MKQIIYKVHKEDARGNVFTVMYDYRIDFGGKTFMIKRGFESDGASVPRFFWRIMFPNTDTTASTAGICHDWIYREQPSDWTRAWADRMFLCKLLEAGMNVNKAILAYRMVRLFGWVAWNSNKSYLEACGK